MLPFCDYQAGPVALGPLWMLIPRVLASERLAVCLMPIQGYNDSQRCLRMGALVSVTLARVHVCLPGVVRSHMRCRCCKTRLALPSCTCGVSIRRPVVARLCSASTMCCATWTAVP